MESSYISREILKGIILIVAFLSSSFNLIGQDGSIENLKAEYIAALVNEDIELAKISLKGLIEKYQQSMAWDSFELYSQHRIDLGEQSSDLEYELEARMDLANIYSIIYNDIKTELEISRHVLSKLDEYRLSPIHISSIYTRMSWALDKSSKTDSSIYYGKLAVEWADKSNDPAYMMLERLGLAEKLFKSKNLLEALEILLETEKMSNNDYLDAIHKIRLYKNLGQLLMVINDFEKSDHYIDKSIELSKKSNYELFVADNEYLKALSLAKQGKTNEAMRYVDSSFAKYNKSNLENKKVRVLLHKAKLFLRQNKLAEYRQLMDGLNTKEVNKILVWFNEADYYKRKKNAPKLNEYISNLETKYETLPTISQLSLRHLKYRYYKLIDDLPMALSAFEKYTAKNEETEKEYQTIKVHRLESEFNREQQDAAIKNLNTLNAAQEKAIAVRNTAMILGSIMLFVLGILLFGLYRLYQRNQENQKQLSTQNEKITKALEQNQMLVKEIHHRVKNNLQVISSLLSMQVRKVTDEDTKDALNSSKSRVQSMSILHQNLYQGENLKDVNVDEYLDQLCQNIEDTYSLDKDVKINLEIEPIALDIDILVPLGLIANELITNAIKHAFKNKEQGNIDVILYAKADILVLKIKDNGIGLSENRIPNVKGSLGSRLIYSFIERLDADIVIDGSDGTEVSISVPNVK